jgi:hypothetical protein
LPVAAPDGCHRDTHRQGQRRAQVMQRCLALYKVERVW